MPSAPQHVASSTWKATPSLPLLYLSNLLRCNSNTLSSEIPTQTSLLRENRAPSCPCFLNTSIKGLTTQCPDYICSLLSLFIDSEQYEGRDRVCIKTVLSWSRVGSEGPFGVALHSGTCPPEEQRLSSPSLEIEPHTDVLYLFDFLSFLFTPWSCLFTKRT